MPATFLIDRFAESAEDPALVWNGTEYSFGDLARRVREQSATLDDESIMAGAVVAVHGDFSPNAVGLLLALIQRGCIVAPFARGGPDRKPLLGIARVQSEFHVDGDDTVSVTAAAYDGSHPFYTRLREQAQPGLVLFTSGSSGEPKAAVHNFAGLLAKFQTRRRGFTTLNFLLFDHWGGLNTMFHTLSNAATLVATHSRAPDDVCALIAAHRIALLPASPTFLNLLLLSRASTRHDLSSLEVISYGTEPMPATTLRRLALEFPGVKLQQTYGLIEIGVLRSKSKDRESLWVKVGGEGYETRVRDGLLEIKADSAMLGYLNAPSPFTQDGWFQTGDAVEIDGEYIRILGRRSELINVGGEKVYPTEVEDVIQGMDNVADCTVYGEPNPLIGQIVCADVQLQSPEASADFARRCKVACAKVLAPFKVPVKVAVVDATQVGERIKKLRLR